MKITFIGGAHIDYMGKLADEVVFGASNPGTLTTFPGGAGLNSARVAAMLGCDVVMAGPVGDDSQGKTIKQIIDNCGITNAMVCVPAGKTGSYTSIIGSDGQVVVAMADLSLNEKMDVKWLDENCRDALSNADMWFLTSNLSQTAIDELVTSANVPIAATTVSVSKAGRLQNVLDELDIVFTNQREAQSLLHTDEENCSELALQLMQRGIARGVVSNGAGPLSFWTETRVFDIEVSEISGVADIIDVTGAGDALAGTVLAAISRGEDFATAVKFGVRAGAATIGVATPVLDELNWEMLK